MKAVQFDRLRQLQELHSKLNECSTKGTRLVQIIEDEIHFSITSVLSADDSRKSAFQLAFDEDQQIVSVSEFCIDAAKYSKCLFV